MNGLDAVFDCIESPVATREVRMAAFSILNGLTEDLLEWQTERIFDVRSRGYWGA